MFHWLDVKVQWRVDSDRYQNRAKFEPKPRCACYTASRPRWGSRALKEENRKGEAREG